MQVGDVVTYRPQYLESQYDGRKVQIVAVNRHGQVTIKFLDGPRKNETRGVRVSDLSI